MLTEVTSKHKYENNKSCTIPFSVKKRESAGLFDPYNI